MRWLTPPWKQQLTDLTSKAKQLVDSWWLQNKDNCLKVADKPGVIPGLLSVLCLSAALGLTNQWQVVVDGEVIGVVKERQAIVDYVKELDCLNKEAYDKSTMLLSDFMVARSYGTPAAKAADLQVVLQNNLRWGLHGAVIMVDDREVAALKDVASAQEVVDNLRNKIAEQLVRRYKQIKIVALNVKENLQVVEKPVCVDQLVDQQAAEEILLTGNKRETRHVVSRGETLSSIAASRGVRVAELTRANPDVKPEGLQVGQALSLQVAEPVVNITTEAEVTEVKPIPYTTEYVKDSSMYKGQSKVVTKGKEGQQEVTSVLNLVNGKVVSSQVKSTKRITEPVNAVIKQGTKSAVVRGTGRFVWPVNGRISSGYGMRWGKLHAAIDIAAASGTPIVAADSGVVTFAGWRGNYGYLVEISHGNGYATRYAHCSKLLVSRGQRVSRGQVVARVGRTGYATGTHVHFEVLYNGRAQNPMRYLR